MVFSSFYEMSNPLTTVRKQHFWDWFSGDTLNSRWTTTGSGSVSVKNEVDGGIVINSGSGGYHAQRIDFGSNLSNTPSYSSDHGVFSYTAHEWIAVFKYISGSVQKTTMGLVGGDGAYGNYQQGMSAVLLDKNANLIYQRRNTGATSTTAQTVDGSWHSAKNTLSGGTLTTSIDGVLSGTGFTSESSGMPTVKSAPILEVYNSNPSGGAAETQFRYFEAYNT